jgi:hypothetical protein
MAFTPMIRLSKIDIAGMHDMSAPGRWGSKTKKDRKVYRSSEGLWYKIWGKDYHPDAFSRNGAWHRIDSKEHLPTAFAIGLFPGDIADAFIDHIYDDDRICRGYVAHGGLHPETIPTDFTEHVFELCLKHGYLYTDFKPDNVIKINGKLSLIDFDTHMTCCRSIDMRFEEEIGVLRELNDNHYRRLVHKHLLRSKP